MKKQILSVAAVGGLMAAPALAAPELIPVVTNDQAAGGSLSSGFFVGGFGAVGSNIYAFVSSNNSGNGYVTAGSPGGNLTPVIGAVALNSLGPGYDDGLSPNGEVLTTGSTLIIPDSLTGGIVSIDTANSNALSLVLSNSQIAAGSGASDSSVRRVSGSGIAPNGDLIFYDTDSDSDALLSTNLTPGNVSLVASSLTLGAFADMDGGTVAGNSYYGVGSNFDTVVKADFDISTGDLDASTFTPVFTTAEYEAIIDPTDDNGASILPREMITGEDGKIYFYDGDVDGIVSFDPVDPLGSLNIAVTEDMLLSAIGSDNITDLLWFDGKLHVVAGNTGSGGLYALVPEPASLSLLALGGLTLRRRR